jgi:hypothetical protein
MFSLRSNYLPCGAPRCARSTQAMLFCIMAPGVTSRDPVEGSVDASSTVRFIELRDLVSADVFSRHLLEYPKLAVACRRSAGLSGRPNEMQASCTNSGVVVA